MLLLQPGSTGCGRTDEALNRSRSEAEASGAPLASWLSRVSRVFFYFCWYGRMNKTNRKNRVNRVTCACSPRAKANSIDGSNRIGQGLKKDQGVASVES